MKLKRTLAMFGFYIAAMLFSYAPVYAAAPSRTLGFQGQLFNGSAPLTGSVNATFTLYDAPSGGSTTGSPVSKTVTVNSGYFAAQFTEGDLSGVNFDQQLYLEVSINGTTLSPRTTLNAAALSLKTFGAFSYPAAPSVGPAGSLYFNSSDNTLNVSNGSAWNVASSQWITASGSLSYGGSIVNIGTTTAAEPLTVDVGVSTGATRSQFVVFRQYNPVAPPSDFLFGGPMVAFSQANSGDTTTNYISAYRTASSNNLAIAARNDIVFSANTSSLFREAMRLSALGRLGIGTSSPVARLSVTGVGSSTSPLVRFSDGDNVSRFSILENGNVGIGTTSPTAQLTNTGTVRFSALTGSGANLVVDTLGNVTVSSDERLKNIQGAFETGLSKIRALNPILYTWKPETGYDSVSTYAGFSAQNVQSAIPEAVSTDARGFLTLADRPILAALVNAVKELASKVDGFATHFFSREIETERICVKKSNGTSVCLTGDELEAVMANRHVNVVPENISASVPVATDTATTTPETVSDTSIPSSTQATVEVPAETQAPEQETVPTQAEDPAPAPAEPVL